MFSRPRKGEQTRHLFIGNCGPAVGLSEDQCLSLLPEAGQPQLVIPSQQASHIFVSFEDVSAAVAAMRHLQRTPCTATFGRSLVVRHAAIKGPEPKPVSGAYTNAEDCEVPGLSLITDFVSSAEEQDMLKSVEGDKWDSLARRRVRHYGYKFEYESRNVDVNKPIEPMPPAVGAVMERVRALPGMPDLDQLTVNEYPIGVGLAPHIDTHSAFKGAICSLSLAGPAVMEFRRQGQHRALKLPQRSLLIMDDEARLAWQHYIPHRKSDVVNSIIIPRAAHRISFTFRQVWAQPCTCRFPECCDSQQGQLPPTRKALQSCGPPSTDGDSLLSSSLHSGHLAMNSDAGSDSASCCSDDFGPNRSNRSNSSSADLSSRSQPSSSNQLVELVERAKLQPWTPQPASFPSSPPTHGEQLVEAQQHNPQYQQAAQTPEDSSAHQSGADSSTSATLPAAAEAAQTTCSCSGCSAAPQVAMNADRAASHQAAGTSGQPQHQQLPSDIPTAHTQEGGQHKAAAARSQSHQQLEGTYVTSMYDAIAPHFSATRFAVWPRVRGFIESLPAGAIVADVGCGNGKYFGVRRDIMVLGSDRSIGLAKVAAQRLDPPLPDEFTTAASLRADVAVADGFVLPLRQNSCDAVLCIAVLHHISSVPRRKAMLEELLRVLKPGGQAYVSVWATLQEDPAKTLAKWEPIQTPSSPPHPQKAAHFSDDCPGSPAFRDSACRSKSAGEPEGALEQPMSQEELHNSPTDDGSGHSSHHESTCQARDGESAAHQRAGMTSSLAEMRRGSSSDTSNVQSIASEGPDGSLHGSAGLQQAPSAAQSSVRSKKLPAGSSNDYFVPWHLPLHRAQATGLLHSIPDAPEWARPQDSKTCPSSRQRATASAAGLDVTPDQLRGVRFDEQKKTLVFRRYYHLFEEGELSELVSSIAGARVADCFYDKSNWCVVMSKVA